MSTQPAAVNVAIRGCEAGDAAAITTIYAHRVLYGLASFELEPPSENDMRQRRLDIVSRGFPNLVAECAGEVVGYAYAPPYRLRRCGGLEWRVRRKNEGEKPRSGKP
jgi:L-amino acid N-acyltransferase YncA